MISYLAALFLASVSGVAIAQEPMPANRLTPKMIAEIEVEYPAAAVACFKESLPKALASDGEYIFTYDYQLGQLWLMSLKAGETDVAYPPYICTPEGLATDAMQIMNAILAGRMGMPY